MKFLILALAAAALLSPALTGDWSESSTTAIGITGDVRLEEHRITFDDRRSFRIDRIRALNTAELEALRDMTGARKATAATLYKIRIPAATKLRNGNTLCGNRATTRMIAATYIDLGTKSLTLVFLPGAREPFFQGWKESAGAICGSFGFVQS
jgi:hypothetical protein